MKVLAATIMRCSQKVDMGLFDRSTKFVFVTSVHNDTESLFKSEAVRNHPSVLSVETLDEETMAFYGYNFYHETNGMSEILLHQTYNLNSASKISFNHVFTEQKTFAGKYFRVLNIPYAYFTQATFLSDEDGGSPNQVGMYIVRRYYYVRTSKSCNFITYLHRLYFDYK